MCAIGLSFGSGVAGFGLVAPVLGLINADIGYELNTPEVGCHLLTETDLTQTCLGSL
jgi:hypothetical protein